MKQHASKSRRAAGRLLVVGALVTSIVAVACTEDVTTSPAAKVIKPEAGPTSIVSVLSCRASVVDMSVNCGAPAASSESKAGDTGVPDAQNIIIGGQDVFVAVKSTNVNYNSGTGAFTFDVTIRNLIPQPLGTADTTGAEAPHADGVRIFFAAGPLVTSGTGLATVVPDGVATITGPNQPYYQYNTVLSQFEISSPKTWRIDMPPSVLTFDFLLLVSAAVPRPDGFIDLQLNSLKPPTDRQTTYTVRNANGTVDGFPGTITWSVSDTTRATIDANGLVNPLRAGSVTIIAQQGLRIGYLTVVVQPIRRVWIGATDNNWATGTNWFPDGVKPEPTDTAVVTDTVSAPVYPTLVQNESVGGVEVHDVTPGGDIPTIALGAFNLTASGDVETTNNSSITNTVGQLLLTGIARTLRGTLPVIRVSGTYSLIGNVTAKTPIRVDLGRLTVTGFRLQGQSF
jgi:hypothetical protein